MDHPPKITCFEQINIKLLDDATAAVKVEGIYEGNDDDIKQMLEKIGHVKQNDNAGVDSIVIKPHSGMT